MNDQMLHDLTILYMKNSLNLSDYKAPDDYARIYFQTSLAIREGYNKTYNSWKETNPSSGPRVRGI